MFVQEMTREECVALVSSGRLGRLACARDNRPYVVPIHYAFADNYLYSFSMPGQKVDWMRTNPSVCVQVDAFSGPQDWRSVVMWGLYEELPESRNSGLDRQHAWFLLQQHANWWEPGGLKPTLQPPTEIPSHLFYRIAVESITGRRTSAS
jgi:nitroimidazol reductase NimA-like FMN-containing flavoprotein (pyridoxamine 5'-phosphate oxidase superfamily)